jgi:hypothetical protein
VRDNPAASAVPGVNSVDNVEQVVTPENATANGLYRVVIKPAEFTDVTGDAHDPAAQYVSVALSGVAVPGIPLAVTSLVPTFDTSNFPDTEFFAELTWNSIAGEYYVIESSQNLTTWTRASEVFNAHADQCSGSTKTFTPIPAGSLYFRVRVLRPFPPL